MPERSLLHTISGTSDNWIGARPKPCELTKNKINNPAAHQQCKQNTDHNRNNPISTIRGLSPFRLALVCVAPTPIQKRRLLEPISKSPEEDNEASELYEAEEVVGVVFPTDEDAALPLNPSKEALHEPTSHIAA